MRYVADLHTHSRYARATGSTLTFENLAAWATIKGLDLLASADFTHPVWRAETQAKLRPVAGDLYQHGETRFVLGTEVSCAYRDRHGGHQIHMLLFAPDLETVDRLSAELERYGNLEEDGRPTLRLAADDLVGLALGVNPRCFLIPAHIWTPWFSVYGSRSGYDSIRDCFPQHWGDIWAVETGLSSDPAMNWRIPELDDRTLVSFSDAHSLARLGREATVFEGELSYEGLQSALRQGQVAYTIEFYPEEGRYHYTGHREHGVRYSPAETARLGTTCPVCRRKLTVGVMDRVERLAQRPDASFRDEDGLIKHRDRPQRPPYRLLVPLQEILAEALGVSAQSKRVQSTYDGIIARFGSELAALQEAAIADIAEVAGDRVAEGVERVRHGRIQVEPGYDGLYGVVRIWPKGNQTAIQGRLL
ncbi:MAG: DNA helicase UvrD [Chloroflexi bacterium]|nr:DNA helicase UvrD [Chloroflexota bacterium]